MAQQQQQAVQLDQERFCCSLCLDLLKDPVSVPCGHNYCSLCIQEYWNQDDQRGRFSCPQCRETFITRPVLKKNSKLADMIELLKKKRLPDGPLDHCYDEPEDVVCDFCTRRKLKAVKTCLQCRVSYCDTHLQPHYQSPVLNNHKLVKASSKLQENICSLHNEVRKLFCRTHQQCICALCSVDEHKGHDIISAEAERTERQKNFDTSQQNIQQRIQERDKYVKVLHQEVKSINHSADRAVDDSDNVFTNLTAAIKRRQSKVREQIRDQGKLSVSRVEEQRMCLKQEIAELRNRHAELEQLSQTEDPILFLNSYTSLSRISKSSHPVSSHVHPQGSFEDATVTVSKLKDKLEDIFKEANITETVNRVDVLLSASLEPQTRAEFVQTIKLEDIFKIKKMKRLFVVILFFVITLTHPIRSSVHPRGIPMDQLEPGVKCLGQGHLKTKPGWLEFWWSTTEPKSRAEFLQYSCPITLDPNTAHQHLSLSKGNKKVTMTKQQSYPHHPERFSDWPQVLSREGLAGCCYWEVEWRGIVDIAVSYKDIFRKGPFSLESLPANKMTAGFNESGFAYSDKAWSFRCAPGSYIFIHRNSITKIPGSFLSSRVGVYLDHRAGALSFYSVSETMTLLHRAQTTFTQPLYAGFGLWFSSGASVTIK